MRPPNGLTARASLIRLAGAWCQLPEIRQNHQVKAPVACEQPMLQHRLDVANRLQRRWMGVYGGSCGRWRPPTGRALKLQLLVVGSASGGVFCCPSAGLRPNRLTLWLKMRAKDDLAPKAVWGHGLTNDQPDDCVARHMRATNNVRRQPSAARLGRDHFWCWRCARFQKAPSVLPA